MTKKHPLEQHYKKRHLPFATFALGTLGFIYGVATLCMLIISPLSKNKK